MLLKQKTLCCLLLTEKNTFGYIPYSIGPPFKINETLNKIR
ncbi:hypothetical protein NOC27_1991 [Nitrosococcus oceani AFC27]|nr:hypothetical protein NOC27_1991 [Nitrosococcus oceani AFC27]